MIDVKSERWKMRGTREASDDGKKRNKGEKNHRRKRRSGENKVGKLRWERRENREHVICGEKEVKGEKKVGKRKEEVEEEKMKMGGKQRGRAGKIKERKEKKEKDRKRRRRERRVKKAGLKTRTPKKKG